MAVLPVADLQLSVVPDGAGGFVLDLAQTSNGDLAQVTGVKRLVQMVILWLLTPQGSDPYDPGYGNPFFARLGRPYVGDTEPLLEMMTQAEIDFKARQSAAAAAGYLSADEMVDRFEDTQVTSLNAGALKISFTVVNQAGVRAAAVISYAYTSGG